MTKLTQAEMEARYDAERNGTLYIKPQLTCPACGASAPASARYCDVCGAQLGAWSAVQAITDNPADDGLTPEEETALDILLAEEADRVIVHSRDAAHRQQRWDAIAEHIAAADEDEQEEIIRLLEAIERHFDAKRASA